MPRRTYSQNSPGDHQGLSERQRGLQPAGKSKTLRKRLRNRGSVAGGHTAKNRVKTVLRYKSAYSPEYTIRIHDIELASFHSDDLQPRSQQQLVLLETEAIPFADQDSEQTYRRFREEWEKRELVRVMRECRLEEEGAAGGQAAMGE